MNIDEARGWLAEAARRGHRIKSRWKPQPGPQTAACECLADELLYGGAAGGGKSDALLGIARNQHRKSIILRRVSPSLAGLIERSREIYNPDAESAALDSFNESLLRWRFHDGCQVRFGHIQHSDDVLKLQGQAHDLYGFDEICEFEESQFRYVTGWNRSIHPGQRCRVICTGNPPTTAEGEWVIKYWAPWLDETFPDPTEPGELRWVTTIAGKDEWVKDNTPFVIVNDRRIYDFDHTKYKPTEIITPRSRTFIPAKVADNQYLVSTGYVSKLQMLPEPLRSKLLLGDFRAGREDDAYQIVPSAWVLLAQDRWRKAQRPTGAMSMLGVDVARGGGDRTVLTPRYGNWVGEQIVEPGKSTPDGPAVAALAMKYRAPMTPINIDIIGVGSSPYDCLLAALRTAKDSDGKVVDQGNLILAMNASEGSDKRDKSGQLGFINKRAEWWWGVREALDPTSGQDIALPPDPELRSDLCAPRWKLSMRGIQVESKDEIIKRIGRSPDKGDSCVYAIAEPRGAGYSYETSIVVKRSPIGMHKVDDDEDDVQPYAARGGGMFGGGSRRV